MLVRNNITPIPAPHPRKCKFGQILALWFVGLSWSLMFSQACVKNSVPPGQTPSLGRHPSWADTPPWQTPPGQTPPLGRHPLGQTPLLGRHPLGRHPLGRQPPGQTFPLGRHPLVRHSLGKHHHLCPPFEMGTEAGMHSSLFLAELSSAV